MVGLDPLAPTITSSSARNASARPLRTAAGVGSTCIVSSPSTSTDSNRDSARARREFGASSQRAGRLRRKSTASVGRALPLLPHSSRSARPRRGGHSASRRTGSRCRRYAARTSARSRSMRARAKRSIRRSPPCHDLGDRLGPSDTRSRILPTTCSYSPPGSCDQAYGDAARVSLGRSVVGRDEGSHGSVWR